MKLPGVLSIALFASLFTSAAVSAAEISGKFSAYAGSNIPGNAKIKVTCGKFEKTGSIKSNGSYSIRGLPSSRGCTYRVEYPNVAKSAPISFNSGTGVVRINAKLRRHGKTIIII